MAKLDAVTAKMIGSPDAFAKKRRSSYLMFFTPSAICAGAAIYYALTHSWVFVCCFVASALMYFPVASLQQRSSKKNTEKAIMEYKRSYQE